MNTSQLQARITATNRANAKANELWHTLATAFQPLVGKKILKQDGNLLAKYENLLPGFPYNASLHVYRYGSPYTLAWTVKACEVVGGIAHYVDVTVYVGDLSNGVLTKLTPKHERRENYTLEEVLAAQARAQAAREAYEEAKSACFPFGEG